MRTVSGGLNTTCKVLTRSSNEAALDLLISALDVPARDIQVSALRALLERRSAAGHRELLERWPTLSERWKTIVAERAGRISGAVRDAILSPDGDLRANGCDAALKIREFDLIPVLITAAEDQNNAQADLAAQTLLSLSEMLFEELDAPRDYRNRRDPKAVHGYVLGALEKSADRFEQHKRAEIVEAFLLLANRQNNSLKRILGSPHDKAYLTTVNLLTHSPRPGVMRLLVSFLDDEHAATAVQNVFARRRDVSFLRHFLKKIGDGPSANLKANLRRIESFVWLRDDVTILTALNEDEQRGAVQLALESGINRLRAFEVL